MSVVRALTVVLIAWVLVMLAPPGPASAGGPTSALLSVPGQGRTASLYYTDAAYEQLADLVGVNGISGEDTSGQSHESGTETTVTWLIHDVTPWRVDRIYLDGDGGPWIATQELHSETGTIWDSPVTWHQPAAGKELTLLLNRLGVGQAGAAGAADGTGAATGADTPASEFEPGPAEPASVEPRSEAPADDSSTTSARDRAWWGLGGLAGGVLLAAGWTRVRSARSQQPPDGWDPDAERLDADPAKEWLTNAGR